MSENFEQYFSTANINFDYIIYLLLTRKLLFNMIRTVIYYQEEI